ncbi:hypothetical protein INR49_022731 [Caranx melampygus]|nr:hypothetical protein INR49_022731 [Caranx melampygus]
MSRFLICSMGVSSVMMETSWTGETRQLRVRRRVVVVEEEEEEGQQDLSWETHPLVHSGRLRAEV